RPALGFVPFLVFAPTLGPLVGGVAPCGSGRAIGAGGRSPSLMVRGGRCMRSLRTRLPTALSSASVNLARYFCNAANSFFERGVFGKAFCILRTNSRAASDVIDDTGSITGLEIGRAHV